MGLALWFEARLTPKIAFLFNADSAQASTDSTARHGSVLLIRGSAGLAIASKVGSCAQRTGDKGTLTGLRWAGTGPSAKEEASVLSSAMF